MALYKHAGALQQNNDVEFDKIHQPGFKAPYSGIYRCAGCGFEVASNEGQPLPPQNHHQHKQGQGLIRWNLVVFAQHQT